MGCDINLFDSELILCTYCKHDLPVIELKNYKKNEIAEVFYGRVNLNMVASFLYYRKENITKDLIHSLKYKNNQNVGVFLGNWLGYHLKKSLKFMDVDYIVPVPLHPSKLKERGYNQLTFFGETLSNILETTYEPNVLKRISATKTQTLKNRFERFSNINTKFNLSNTSVFNNKHILLIDDVITSGATLEACCNELQKTQNITISIVTIAFTEKK